MFTVIKNVKNQYSLWLAEKTIPKGWNTTNKVGSKEECLAYVKSIWTDLQPIDIQSSFIGFSSKKEGSVGKENIVHNTYNPSSVASSDSNAPKIHYDNDLSIFAIDPVLTIHREGKQSPLFLIHAASGLALPYSRLSKFPNRPLYGISNPRFGSDKPFASIREMASTYIALIKTVQNIGPYYLGGWSLGGVVALEMAQLLQSLSEQVATVIMIDSINFAAKPIEEKYDYRNVNKLLFQQKIEIYSPQGQEIRHQYRLASELLSKYHPEPYAGKIVLFKAQQQKEIPENDTEALKAWKHDIARDPFNRWKEFDLPQLNVVSLSGEHDELFEEPYLTELHQKIINFLTINVSPSI